MIEELEVEDTEATARQRLAETLADTIEQHVSAVLHDRYRQREDDLLALLAKLFDWSDTSYLHAMLHIENAVKNLRADLAVAKMAANGELKKIETTIDNMRVVGATTSADLSGPDRPYGGGWERMQSEIDALQNDVNRLEQQMMTRLQPDDGHWCTDCRGEWDGIQSRNSHCSHITAKLDAEAEPPVESPARLKVGDLVVYDRARFGLRYVGTLEEKSDTNSCYDARIRYYKDAGCPRFWAPLSTLQHIDRSLVEKFYKVKADPDCP